MGQSKSSRLLLTVSVQTSKLLGTYHRELTIARIDASLQTHMLLNLKRSVARNGRKILILGVSLVMDNSLWILFAVGVQDKLASRCGSMRCPGPATTRQAGDLAYVRGIAIPPRGALEGLTGAFHYIIRLCIRLHFNQSSFV